MNQAPAEPEQEPKPVTTQPSRSRQISAYILLGLFCLVVPFSATAIWARNEVFNTDRYVDTVDELAADPVVQAAAATRVSDAIFERIDLGSRLAEALPGDQRILLGPATAAVENWVTQEIERFFASDEWQRIWNEANRVAHASLVAVLTGEGRGNLNVEGGQVILDLSPLVARIESRLGERGLDIVNQVTAGQPINAEIVILDSPELERARRAADLLDRLAYVLLLVALAALIAYFILAPSKRKAVIHAGLGLAVAMTIFLVLLAIARSLYLSGIDLESRRAVARVFFDTIVERIRTGSRALIVIGLLAALIGFLLGFAGRVQIPALAGAGPWIRVHRTVLGASVVGVACFVLVLWDRPSTAVVGWILVIAAVLLLTIWLVGRQAAFPPGGEAAASPGD
jgi:hypothetical protein